MSADEETKAHRMHAFWISCAIAAAIGILIGLAFCPAAYAEQDEYCDGHAIIDYCAPLPEHEEEYEDCPVLCGVHRCDIWYHRGQCGKVRQAVEAESNSV